MKFILIPDISAIHAENCGTAILSPGWIHNKRNLDTSVFILGHQGSVKLKEENNTLTIEPKSYCILSEGKNHWGKDPLNDKARYYWIHFKSSSPPQEIPPKEALIILNNREIARTRLSDSLLLPINMELHNDKVLREMFHELLYLQQNPSFTVSKYQAQVKLMLITLNEMVFEHFSHRDHQMKNTSLVHNIIQKIYENLSDCNFSVKQLADQMCYNPDYLNRHFKKIMKRSLIEYIIDIRIEHSLTELIDSNKTQDTIARDSGFSTYRNYIRQFKLRKNMTPSEYRTRHRMMHITNK